MNKTWIKTAWEEGAKRLCDASDEADTLMRHVLPIFLKCVICVTGLNPEAREETKVFS